MTDVLLAEAFGVSLELQIRRHFIKYETVKTVAIGFCTFQRNQVSVLLSNVTTEI
jgi:hypothetical protein